MNRIGANEGSLTIFTFGLLSYSWQRDHAGFLTRKYVRLAREGSQSREKEKVRKSMDFGNIHRQNYSFGEQQSHKQRRKGEWLSEIGKDKTIESFGNRKTQPKS